MKLTFVAPFGLRPKSTVSVRMLPLARHLVRRGHQVSLLVPPWDNPEDGGLDFADQGVRVVNLRLPGRVRAGAIPVTGYPALALRLLNRTVATQPDVVHAFKPKGFSGGVAQALLARQALTGKRVPVVVDTDDWEGVGGWNERAGYPRWQRFLFSYQERWLLEHACAVTAASQTLVALAGKLRGPRPCEVTYLPNGPGAVAGPATLDAKGLRVRLGVGHAPVLLLYTRFVESGPERTARMIRAIHQQGAQPITLLVGAGLNGEEGTFLRAMKDLPVVNAGWVPGADLPAYFALADAAIFPMEDDLLNRAKCSVKLVDLLNAGVPVVAEAVGQCTEYIETGSSGLLVPPDDFSTFGKAVAGLLQDAGLRARLGEGARARIAVEFNWERIAARLEEVYERLVRP